MMLDDHLQVCKEAAAEVIQLKPPRHGRQRLYVNPKDGMLYVGENGFSIEGKSFADLIKIHPETGEMSLGWEVVVPPFNYDLGDAGKGPPGDLEIAPVTHGTDISGEGFGLLVATTRGVVAVRQIAVRPLPLPRFSP